MSNEEKSKKELFKTETMKRIEASDIPDHLFEPTFLLDLPRGIHRHKIPELGRTEIDEWFIQQGASPGETIYLEIDY